MLLTRFTCITCCFLICKAYFPKSLDTYHDYEGLTEYVFRMQAMYPELVTVYSIGKSVENRHLWVTRISTEVDNSRKLLVQKRKQLKPMVKIVANMHGNEVIGRELSLGLTDFLMEMYKRNNSRIQNLIKNIDLHILHSMNPDGFEKAEQVCKSKIGRSNANGKDLNRDFPTYFDLKKAKSYQNVLLNREPETQAVMNWIVENPFVLSMNLHDGATVACYPFDDFYSLANDNLKEKIKQFANNEKNHNNISYSPDHELVVHMASKYAQNNPLMKTGNRCPEFSFHQGIVNGAQWYPLRGGMQDFNYFYSNCIELTFELSCCKYPEVKALKTEWKLNLNSMITFLEMAQIGIKGLVIDRKTGRPIKGAIIHIDGLKHDVSTSYNGDYFRLLLPGTYKISVIHPLTKNIYGPSDIKVQENIPTRKDFQV